MIVIYVNKTVHILDRNKYRCYLFVFKTYQNGIHIVYQLLAEIFWLFKIKDDK